MGLEYNERVRKYGNLDKENKRHHLSIQKTLNLYLLINKNKLIRIITNSNKNVRKEQTIMVN